MTLVEQLGVLVGSSILGGAGVCGLVWVLRRTVWR